MPKKEHPDLWVFGLWAEVVEYVDLADQLRDLFGDDAQGHTITLIGAALQSALRQVSDRPSVLTSGGRHHPCNAQGAPARR